MTTPLETRLRQSLVSQASRIPDDPDPYATVARRLTRARRQRRTALAAVVVTVAAVVSGVSAGTYVHDRTLAVAQAETILRWPVRGSLARDTAFLAAVRSRMGGDSAHVLFAGDDGAGHRAVVVAVGHHRSALTGFVMYGPTGTPAQELRLEEIFNGEPSARAEPAIVVFEPDNGSTLLVVGSPRMTAVKVSPSISYRPDGTPVRGTRVVPAVQGAVFLPVPEAKAGQLLVKARIDGTYRGAVGPAWSLSLPHRLTTPFGDRVAKAAAAARGQVNAGEALGLLYGLGTLAALPDRLAYRFVWGASLGGGQSALIATVSAPGTPTFLIVQTTRTFPDGSTRQDRLGRVVTKGGAATEPVAWTTAPGEGDDSPATVAVYVPGRPGGRVELWKADAMIASGRTGPSGLAVLPTGLPRSVVRALEYRVLDAAGNVTHHGRPDLGALDIAIAGSPDW